jgi:GTPase
MFVDEARIHVKSGDGGNGAMQFRREKYIPLGGPSGGDGGRGGDVVLIVDTRLNTLSKFHYRTQFNAENGGNGASSNKSGKSADELIIEVPPGTVVRDANTGELLADLTVPGQRAVIVRGGQGGRGNARFKSSTNQAPRMAERGEPGEERELLLELKVLADVGIVGVPNAGKSTLLSVVTAAKPKIANYPFTTLTPNLGVAEAADREIVLADIPGLVEGAHQGVGLGHSFLRHIQRTRLLIHLLDGAGEDPIGDFVQINTELALFDPELARRPQIVVLNKVDLPQAKERWEAVKAFVEERGYTTFQISAVAHQGVRDLLNHVAQRLAELPQAVESEEIPVFKPEDEGEAFAIVRENEAYRIVGKRIERAASMTYWEYEEAVVRFYRILEALGIADALREAGIEAGDSVLIGEYELEWED